MNTTTTLSWCKGAIIAVALVPAPVAVAGASAESREMKTALDSEPLSLAINTGVGWSLYIAKQYDRSIAQYRKTLEMDPNFVLAEGA